MDSPLVSPSPLDTTGYHSSSISEVDSLSDSEWLDLASNRESDDNDSVCSRESYRDYDIDHYRGPSRRSSTSDLSSRDGDVEAWEGLVDDSADEGTSGEHAAAVIPSVLPRSTYQETRPDSTGNTSVRREVSEEDRVKAALDQSMIGTLSSSRSSSLGHSRTSAVHSSRDLRLSFPDPLTSSRDELNTFDEVSSPSDATFSATEGEDPLPCSPAGNSPLNFNPTPPPSAAEDPPFLPANISSTTRDFDVVLYGQSSDTKWSFVHKLLQKVEELDCGEPSLPFSTLRIVGSRCQHFCAPGSPSFPNGIDVIDRTIPVSPFNLSDTNWSAKDIWGRPSLAVIYLPSSQSPPLDHTYYLPVLLSSEPVARGAAIADWKTLDIPASKIFPCRANHLQNPFMDSNSIDELSPSDVRDAFLVLKSAPQKKASRAGSDRVNVNAKQATVLALLTLIVGVAINITIRPSSTPTRTSNLENRTSWALWNTTPNHSAVISPSTSDAVNTAIVPSSLKDFALAVFSPNATPSPIRSPCSSSGAVPDCQCKMMTWSERFQSSKDIILRDVPSSLSLDAHSKAARSKAHAAHSKAMSLLAPAHKRAEALSSSLSLKLVDSLTEIFDVKAMTRVFENDMKEIMDAIDILMQVIGRHTTIIMEQSKGTVQTLRDRLQYRHARAQMRAKKLMEMGEQFVVVAGEKFTGRANIARQKARALKDSLVSKTWVLHRNRIEVFARTAAAEWKKRERRSRRLKRREGKMGKTCAFVKMN